MKQVVHDIVMYSANILVLLQSKLVDHSCDATVGLAPHQKSDRASRANTLQVGFVLLVAARRKDPRPMQAFAPPRGLENLVLAIGTKL